MATSFSYYILYLGLYSRVISVGVGAWRFRYLHGPILLFFVLEAFGLTMAVYSHWISTDNNTYLSYISTGIDVVFMSLIYAPLMPNKLLRRAAWAFSPVFIGLLLADYAWGEGLRQQGANYLAGLECLIVGGFLIVYLRDQLDDVRIFSLRRYPMFLISACLLLISLIALPVYWLTPALMSYSMTLTMRAYDLMFLSAFVAHLGYATAFWFTKEYALQPASEQPPSALAN